jgi:hypothetical protein
MEISRPAGLSALPERYGPLFDRAAAQFAADERVRGMWLHGAIGRGQADAGSDMDVTIAVRDEDFAAFASEWQEWLAAITPTVSARPICPGSFYALTPTCERFDVISERVSGLPGTSLCRRAAVFDRDSLSALIPSPADPPPDPGKISLLIEETLRQAANFPTVIIRDDWLMGVVAVQQIQLYLYELFAESNKPAPPTGPKQWSAKLTQYQRKVLAGLPAPAASELSVRSARDAALAAFLAEARPVAARTGVPWPDDLENAVSAFLATEGCPLPAGLGLLS